MPNNFYLDWKWDKIKTEVEELQGHLRELQLNRPIISPASVKVQPLSFDGTVPFHVLKFQFEKKNIKWIYTGGITNYSKLGV